jgi:hypothetical protein
MGAFRSKPKLGKQKDVERVNEEAIPEEASLHSLPKESTHSAPKSEVETIAVPEPVVIKQSYFKKKIEIRKPLTKYEEILESDEAHEVIKTALLDNPPGFLNRWDKILKQINVNNQPTAEDPSPFNVEISLLDLRKLLSAFYSSVTRVDSEGVVLMRDKMPIIFDKHSVDRGKRVSQYEREKNEIIDECYAYGEMDYEIFATIFIKIKATYGINNTKGFVDLGCGVGQIVYAASFIGSFSNLFGIENIKSLVDRAEKRERIWRKLVENSSIGQLNPKFRFLKSDFISNDEWVKSSSFIFLHWTAFSKTQVADISRMLMDCNEGTMVISITHPISDIAGYEILERGFCEVSWGQAEYIFQEKCG